MSERKGAGARATRVSGGSKGGRLFAITRADVGWLLAGYLAGVVYVFVHQPDVLSTADVHTEQVSFRVIDPPKAAFHVEGMRAAPVGTMPTGSCLDGLFTPGKRVTVTYGRLGEGPMEIKVIPPPEEADPDRYESGTFWSRGAARPTQYRGAYYMTEDRTCPQPDSFQFPIWGLVTVGQEYRPVEGAERPEPGLLLDGSLKVAAHEVFGSSLYEVTNVTIPVGGRLEAFDPAHDANVLVSSPKEVASPSDPGLVLWWGTAYKDPQRTALAVELGTEAPRLAIYRPNRTHADVIGVSGLTELTKDPSFVRYQIFMILIGAIFVIFERGKTVHGWLFRGERK